MIRVIGPALKARLEPSIKATEQEFQQLWARYKENRWHGLGTKASFEEAELESNVYDRYYRQSISYFSRAAVHLVVRKGEVRARQDEHGRA